MLFIRVVHGISAFIAVRGVNSHSIEITPLRLRKFRRTTHRLNLDIGTINQHCHLLKLEEMELFLLVLANMHCILASTAAIIFIYLDSPRFLLVEGRETDARSVFRRISKIFGTEEIMDNRV